MAQKYMFSLLGETKEANGFGDSVLECKEKAREQLKGSQYNIKDICIVECVERKEATQ